MFELLKSILQSDERVDLGQFLLWLRHYQESRYILRNDILAAFSVYSADQKKPDVYYQSSSLRKLIYHTQEIMIEDESCCLVTRPKIATQEILRITSDLSVAVMSVEELLDLHDRLVHRSHPNEGSLLEIDFQPFYDYSPTTRDPKNIGKGVQFLNRYLSLLLSLHQRQCQTTG